MRNILFALAIVILSGILMLSGMKADASSSGCGRLLNPPGYVFVAEWAMDNGEIYQ